MKILDGLPDHLRARNLIDDEQRSFFNSLNRRELNSIYHELRVALSLGAILFTSGIGMVVYNNYTSIGRLGILFLLVTAATLFSWLSLKSKPPFSRGEVKSPNVGYDFFVLFAYTFFATCFGYADFAFDLSADRHANVALVCAVFGIYWSYFHDHKGVLSLAIVAMASFIGLNLNLQSLNISHVYMTGMMFGILLTVAALLLYSNKFKAHFTVVYLHFSSACVLLSCLTAMFREQHLFAVFTLIAAAVFAKLALYFKSLLIIVYSYGAASITGGYLLVRSFETASSRSIEGLVFVMSLYIFGCGVGLFILVSKLRKRLEGVSS